MVVIPFDSVHCKVTIISTNSRETFTQDSSLIFLLILVQFLKLWQFKTLDTNVIIQRRVSDEAIVPTHTITDYTIGTHVSLNHLKLGHAGLAGIHLIENGHEIVSVGKHFLTGVELDLQLCPLIVNLLLPEVYNTCLCEQVSTPYKYL